MNAPYEAVARPLESALATNKVIRNTYLLLSATLLWSAVIAGVSMTLRLPGPNLLVFLAVALGLPFAISKFRDSAVGLVLVFVFTGFLGYALGPVLTRYLTMVPNGGQVVMTALAGTGFIFVGLSAYALTTRKDFSFMGGFLMAGILVAFLAGIGAVLFHIPMLSLGVSAMFVLLMSGLILYKTSDLVHGYETNYIEATVDLYVAIFNLFTSLLRILGVFSSDD